MQAIRILGWFAFLVGLVVPGSARGQQPGATETSYLPVAGNQVHAHLLKLRTEGTVAGRDAKSVWKIA